MTPDIWAISTAQVGYYIGSYVTNAFLTVDCILSTTWSQWSSCSVTCGNGIQERHRIARVKKRNGGTCNNQQQMQPCAKELCPPEPVLVTGPAIVVPVVVSVVLIILLILVSTGVFILYKKKPDLFSKRIGSDGSFIQFSSFSDICKGETTPAPVITMISSDAKHIILKKDTNLLKNITDVTADAWRLNEEFSRLEAHVAETITRFKTTEVAQLEANKKANRYKDIGIISFLKHLNSS